MTSLHELTWQFQLLEDKKKVLYAYRVHTAHGIFVYLFASSFLYVSFFLHGDVADDSAHFGLFSLLWSSSVCSVHFGSPQFTSIHFGPDWSIWPPLVYSTHFSSTKKLAQQISAQSFEKKKQKKKAKVIEYFKILFN